LGGKALQVARWGNSRAVRLPARRVREPGLKAGDQVDARADAGGLRVARRRRPEESLATPERFRGRRAAARRLRRDEAHERQVLESNIILALLDDGPKRDATACLLAEGGSVSVQVLNEVLLKCRRRAGMSWQEAEEFLDGAREICDLVSLSPDIHDLGRALGARDSLGVSDAMTVAAPIPAA
jgi:predicted nucleic acid-binding protein/antitoxin component of MazEF toxin-antitoxin module